MRRTAFAAALLVLAAACGDAGQQADQPQSGASDAQAAQQPAQSQPAPAEAGAAQPQSPAEVARATNDSIAEAQLYHRRMGSMDDLASCMAKTKGADPAQRPVLEAACKRSHGGAR